MIQSLNVPILGIVENMSYYPCPDTGKPHYIFGPSHADEIAEKSGAPVWARLPIDPRVAELADAGAIEQADVSTFAEIVGRLNQPK